MVHAVIRLMKRLLFPRARSAIQSLFPFDRSHVAICKRWRKAEPQGWPPARSPSRRVDLAAYEYSLFSQNGEDGIIRYLLSRTGPPLRLFLEFGFSPNECNCLRLAVKESYSGLFIDGDERCVRNFQRAARKFGLVNVKAVAEILTVENLEQVVTRGGLCGEIDVASIDVDGNDYWLWEKLQCVSPRIVVIEYNPSLGPKLSLTVPYDPTFDRHKKHPSGFYHGASLTALQRLGKRKGYRLVGCNSTGGNAFFLRDDIVAPDIETLSPEEAYKPSKYRLDRGFSLEAQYQLIADLPYVEIS